MDVILSFFGTVLAWILILTFGVGLLLLAVQLFLIAVGSDICLFDDSQKKDDSNVDITIHINKEA